MRKGKDKPTMAQNCLFGALVCLMTGCQLEKRRGVRQKKHTGANQRRRTKSLVSCTHLGCMKEENGKLNRFSIFKKREQYTYHRALQRRIQNGGKRTEAKPMKSSQVLLHNCQRHSAATFCHKEGAERTEPKRTRNDRASKRTAAVKDQRRLAGTRAVPGAEGGRPRWTRAWPLSSAAVARSGGRSQTPSGAASEKPLRTSALPRGPRLPPGAARAAPGGRSALYLRRPLSMKHKSPQLLSASSFSTSVSPGASMAPATGSGVVTGAQRRA